MRPINKRYFGPLGEAGQQIQVTAWVEGDNQARIGSIVSQKGTRTYIVDTTLNGGEKGRCILVNTAPSKAGEMTITVTPHSSNVIGHGAIVHAVMGVESATIVNAGSNYSVNDVLTVVGGEGVSATITVDTVDVGGEILTATVTLAGEYTELPVGPVNVTGGDGSDATFTLGYEVVDAVIDNGGEGYDDATVVFSAGTATATATITGGVITAISITDGGSYTVIPTMTITTSEVPPVEFASKISAHFVVTFENNQYVWKLTGEPISDGEATIQSA